MLAEHDDILSNSSPRFLGDRRFRWRRLPSQPSSSKSDGDDWIIQHTQALSLCFCLCLQFTLALSLFHVMCALIQNNRFSFSPGAPSSCCNTFPRHTEVFTAVFSRPRQCDWFHVLNLFKVVPVDDNQYLLITLLPWMHYRLMLVWFSSLANYNFWSIFQAFFKVLRYCNLWEISATIRMKSFSCHCVCNA